MISLRIKHFFLWITLGYCSVSCTVVAPSRWVRCGLAGAEHVAAIAHVIVRHEQLTGEGVESDVRQVQGCLACFSGATWQILPASGCAQDGTGVGNVPQAGMMENEHIFLGHFFRRSSAAAVARTKAAPASRYVV